VELQFSFFLLTLLLLAVFAAFLVWLGVKAQRKPAMTGNEGMVGLTGFITSRRGFRDRQVVEVRGELWWCTGKAEIPPGTEVRVTGIDDLTLEVAPLEDSPAR